MFLARVTEDWDPSTTVPVFDGTGVADEFTFGNNGPASAGPAVDIDFEIDVTDIVRQWQAGTAENFGFRLSMADAFVGAAFDATGPDAPACG
jgi:hypothetical protein